MHGEAGGGRGGGGDNDNIYIYINRYRSSSSQVILLRNSSLCLSAAEWPLSPAAAQYYYYARETSNNSFGATTASYAAFLSLYTHTHVYFNCGQGEWVKAHAYVYIVFAGFVPVNSIRARIV